MKTHLLRHLPPPALGLEVLRDYVAGIGKQRMTNKKRFKIPFINQDPFIESFRILKSSTKFLTYRF